MEDKNTKNYTAWGAVAGVALALALYFGGVELLLLLVVFGAVGALIGAHMDGSINVVDAFNQLVGRGHE